MRSIHYRWLLALAALATLTARGGAADPQPKDLTNLFNGKDLNGWHGRARFDSAELARLPEAERKALLAEWAADAQRHWKVDGGEVVGDGKGVTLATDQDFGDVELLVDFRAGAGADGGVYL